MKKTFLLLGAMALTGLTAPKANAQGYELRVLTFEDANLGSSFSGQAGVNNYVTAWSEMIAADQGSDAMLYGDNYGSETEQFYWWHDGGNTELFSELNYAWGAYAYWSGGHAISNYWSSNVETYGDYMSQLTVYRPGSDDMNTAGGGHNGSNQFAVHFGYNDGSAYSTDSRVKLSFADGVARVIDHMWVCPTTYALNCFMNGNELTSNLSDDDYVKLIAEGYVNDSKVNECEFVMANGNSIVMDWSKWDLSSLGAVDYILLNIIGTNDNGYGFSQPAYFAYDDVAVRFPVETPAEPTSYERTGLTTGNYGTICLPYDVAAADRTGATFFEAIGKTAEGLVLEEVSGTLTAGKAYFFQATATSLECTYSGDKVATPVSASLNNGLQGVYEDNTDVPNGMYFLNSNKLWQSSGSNKVDANRAYVDLNYVPNYVPAPVAGRRRVVMPCIPEETTALPSEVENETNVTKQMINGKLYIQKNGRMYDAQGKNIQ